MVVLWRFPITSAPLRKCEAWTQDLCTHSWVHTSTEALWDTPCFSFSWASIIRPTVWRRHMETKEWMGGIDVEFCCRISGGESVLHATWILKPLLVPMNLSWSVWFRVNYWHCVSAVSLQQYQPSHRLSRLIASHYGKGKGGSILGS